jgi:hypothetical protein
MSEIAVKTQNTLVQPLDARCIHSCVFLGDPSVPTVDLITDIPKTVLLGKSQSSIAEVKSIQLANVNNEAQPKWTEDYNANAANATAWTKLNGLSSPATPRPVQILSGVPNSKFDAIGVLIPGAPIQTDDLGEASKIAITGLGNREVVLFTDATYSNAYAGYALYPPVSRQIYLSPEGNLYIFISLIYDGSAHSRCIYGKSTTGGLSWVWTEVNPTESEGHAHTALAVDKYGDIHFVWVTTTHANVLYKLKHAKLNVKTGVIGSISTINAVGNTWNICPSIQIDADGERLHIVWLSAADAATYPNIYSRIVNFNGTLASAVQVTSDGGANISYQYVTMDVDSNGYKHIVSIAKKNATTEFNIYYKYENGAGWQAAQQVNPAAGETKLAHYISNVLIDKNNKVYIAYDIGPFDSTTKTPLYLKTALNGTLSSRITIQAGNPDVGGTIPYMQFDKNGDINIVFLSNTAPDTYNSRKIFKNGSIGSLVTLHIVEDDHDLSYIHTPSGLFPNINNINPNVSQQNLFYIYADYVTGSPGAIDIKLGYIEDCIMGASITPAMVNYQSINIRGSINKTKFNGMANPAIL